MSLRYHPEVDGLRAVAVLSVIAYHALPQRFGGGFTGVDVFFVISGYLISGIIWDGLEAGKFTIAGFYERRIRRILPALSVVLLAVAGACWFLYLARDLAAMGRSLAGAALSAANVVFWREAGYFSGASDTKPLLHAWSLAVEEQFYIVYPLLLIGIHRRWRARAPQVMAALCALSLLAALWASHARPGAAFYLAPFRAWELLLGGLLSVASVPSVTRRAAREVLAVIAWLMVLGSLAWVSESTPFPVPGAVPACLGTALLIHVSRSGATTACRPLVLRPVVAVGLISYSLYLWHWPLLAIARYASVPRPSAALLAACIAAAFLLAALTWRFIEQPARAPGGRLSRRGVFASAAVVLLAFTGAGLAMAWSGGFASRLGERAEALAAASGDVDPHRADYLSDRKRRVAPQEARVFGASVAPRMAIWGDSHGAALLPAIAASAERHGQSVRFLGYAGMPPLLGVRVTAGEGALDGERYNEEAMRFLEDARDLETVILVSRWARYVEGAVEDFGAETGGLAGRGPTLRGDAAAPPREAFAAGLHATVLRLTQAGKRVVLVGPIPEFGIEVPRALALLAARGEDPERFVLPAAIFDARQGAILRALDAERGPRVLRVDPHEFLRRGNGYAAMADGKPLYHDDDHLSLAGAAFVSGAFDSLFAGELSPNGGTGGAAGIGDSP